MDENSTKDAFDEKDDFWDIDKLVPKKISALRPFVTRPTTTLYEAESDVPKASEDEVKKAEDEKAERKITFARHGIESTEDKPQDETYYPLGNRLIKRVTIKRAKDKYDFYGNFRKAALIYYDYKTNKCEYTPFFSYMPQYSQLNAEQKNYYFYWRSEIRRGKFPKTDYSYLYLYVYEILNLPDKIPADEGIKILTSLWREYRESLPKIGAKFSVWIQDYCFIHKLPCPSEALSGFMYEAIGSSSFKEFYLSDIKSADPESVGSMIAFLSDYDWRKGKFIEEATDTALYKKCMYTAMKSLLLRLDSWGELYGDDTATQVLTRNAFPDSLCTHSVKCRLEIEYISLSGADALRASITAAVRYTENKIRAMMGVKSRLAVKDLPDRYKELIDMYFTLAENRDERIRAKEQVPEYEKLYDALSVGLSFAGADEIEKASWATTQRLVVEEDTPDEEENAEEVHSTKMSEKSQNVSEADTYGLSDADIAFVSAVHKGDAPLYDEITQDSAAERINEAFSDAIGDVVLYHDGEKYMIYDDYMEEIGEWLLKLMK